MDTGLFSSDGLIKTIFKWIPDFTWPTLVAVLVFVFIVTRITTGVQSRRGKIDAEEPRDVKMIPYWIPWLGNGLSFAWDPINLLTKARDSMNEPVFGIRLDGKKHNIVLTPSMGRSILTFRGTSSNSLINYVLEKVFGDLGPIRSLSPADQNLLAHNEPNLLMREPHLSESTDTALRLIKRDMANFVTFSPSIVDQTPWERGSQVVVENESDQSFCEANFFALIRGFVGQITTSALMGQALLEAFPETLEHVWKLDSQFTKMSMGLPRWLLPGLSAAHRSRDQLLYILAVFHEAFAAWDDGVDPGVKFRDLDDVSEPIKQRIQTSRKLGLSPTASAPGHLSLLWGMNANTPNVVFYNLLRIYADPKLMKEIREEIEPYVKVSRASCEETGFFFQEPPKLSIELDGLLKSCPLLKASFYETLRLDTAGFSFRELTADLNITESKEDAEINGLTTPRTYKIRKGEHVIIPYGVQHADSRYFSNPAQYDPQRFVITDPGTGERKADMKAISPFGGGVGACKGRAFGERLSLVLVAAILAMWDVQPANGNEFKVPGHKLATGAYLPKNDVRVKLRMTV